MAANPHGPKPPPLTPEECARIWRWERGMVLFYPSAMIALGLAAVAASVYGGTSGGRLTILAGLVLLAAAGSFMRLREKCPRCGLRLGRQSRLGLPDACRACGVPFPRPPKSAVRAQP